MRSIAFPSFIAVALALLAGTARAHLDLLSPTPRTKSLKQGPCGAGPDDPRGPTVATFMPGEKIVVTWNEYIDHPGHFRIAFDDDGQDIFVDPKGFDDVGGGPGVILDGIADKQGGDYMQEIVLPNIECDNCVLQVIQVMSDKPPYGDGNDMYYQCADIALKGEVASTTTGEPGTATDASTGAPDPSAGESSGGAGSTSADPSAGETAAPHTSDTPTSDGGGSTSGGGTGGSGGSASDGMDTSGGEDKGCGCRGDAGGSLAGGLALWIVPLALRRRRRG